VLDETPNERCVGSRLSGDSLSLDTLSGDSRVGDRTAGDSRGDESGAAPDADSVSGGIRDSSTRRRALISAPPPVSALIFRSELLRPEATEEGRGDSDSGGASSVTARLYQRPAGGAT